MQEESNIRLSAGFTAANRLRTCELGVKCSHIRAVLCIGVNYYTRFKAALSHVQAA